MDCPAHVPNVLCLTRNPTCVTVHVVGNYMMTPVLRLRVSTLACLFLATAVLVGSGFPHGEPVKTEKERAEKERVRLRMEQSAVKTQTAWLIDSTGSGRPIDSTLLSTVSYDSLGHALRERDFDSSGATTTVELYDANGTWLEELTYTGDSLDGRSLFLYDHRGLISRVQDFDGNGVLTAELSYRTVEKDNLIVAEKRAADSTLLYRLEYSYEPGATFARQSGAVQYDAEGNVKLRSRSVHEGDRRIQKFVLSPTGELNFSFEYQYTTDGDYQEIIRRDPNGTIILRQVFVYGPDGLLAGLRDLNADNVTKRIVRYHYDFYDRRK